MRNAQIYIGTSGYSYNHWRGVFYPEDLRQDNWLEYYAKSFHTVELNVTFYRLPQEKVFLGWYRKTPKDFKFAVKGSRFITHIKKLADCEDALKLFFSRAKLLKDKLGPVLWQLAPFFKADSKRLGSFLKALKKYRKTRHVFEFRNQTWYCKGVFKMLKDAGVSLCSADYPEFNKDIHPALAGKGGMNTTADFIYIRRHGQGARLYDGCYSSAQLKKDAGLVEKHLKEKKDVYIYFNNDVKGYAVKNALELRKLVRR